MGFVRAHRRPHPSRSDLTCPPFIPHFPLPVPTPLGSVPRQIAISFRSFNISRVSHYLLSCLFTSLLEPLSRQGFENAGDEGSGIVHLPGLCRKIEWHTFPKKFCRLPFEVVAAGELHFSGQRGICLFVSLAFTHVFAFVRLRDPHPLSSRGARGSWELRSK